MEVLPDLNAHRVLSPAAIASNDWADRIIALDSENMTQILRSISNEDAAYGINFPCCNDLVNGEELAGYISAATERKQA